MLKKLFLIIIIGNLCLCLWQTVFSISLSTQGDVLSNYLQQVEALKNQNDLLHRQISLNSSLNHIHPRALALGFVPAKIIRLGNIKLADAGLK